MSKALEVLECIVVDLTPIAKEHNKEEIEQVKNSLKALEIIIKKEVNIHLLKISVGRIHYNWLTEDPNHCLTIKEYNLLKKEVLKYGKL